MKTIGRIIGLALLSGIAFTSYGKEIQKMTDMKNPGVKDEKLQLTTEWDKIFPKSDKVDHCKVTFHNRFGITLAADLYKPKNAKGKRPAIAVSGPFGAVKEQSSGIYAQQLAERGFLTIAFDPSFTGESGGTPRFVASPDINTEDFSAAVDYLSNRSDVDPERIGIVGICGWGGMAINAAAIDTRIKATVAVTMYDMTRVTANGY
ncbi:MAG: alpha/beta hydrolase, partial [Lentisphaeria bacterium]|nr:alpha/beta hydrolase [Lentisphaeria bacterium]